MSQDKFRYLSRESGVFTDLSLEFQEKIMERSGLGDETYLPEGMLLNIWILSYLTNICVKR